MTGEACPAMWRRGLEASALVNWERFQYWLVFGGPLRPSDSLVYNACGSEQPIGSRTYPLRRWRRLSGMAQLGRLPWFLAADQGGQRMRIAYHAMIFRPATGLVFVAAATTDRLGATIVSLGFEGVRVALRPSSIW
jgi:hypothetical protein